MTRSFKPVKLLSYDSKVKTVSWFFRNGFSLVRFT